MPLYDFKCGEGHGFERMVPLANFHEVQHCTCGAPAERRISRIRIGTNDSIDPIRGPDGKMHTSLASYRKSLAPDGNPQGERYFELGDQELPHAPPEFDRKTRRDNIKEAIADVKNGRVPPAVTGELP